MRAFRIADHRFPVFDGTGASIVGGRWNSPGRPVIYAAQTFSSAMLEVLVHSNVGQVPKTHVVFEISIPDRVSVELLNGLALVGWDDADQNTSRHFGDIWLKKRSAVLLVPSLITKGREYSILINPKRGEFVNISASEPEDVERDTRLFQRRME